MNLRTLEQFVVVAEEKTILHASKKLHITQSALSRKMKLLEKEIGVLLLTRHHDGVTLTVAGKSFLEDAKLIIAAIHTAKADMLNRNKKNSSDLVRTSAVMPVIPSGIAGQEFMISAQRHSTQTSCRYSPIHP